MSKQWQWGAPVECGKLTVRLGKRGMTCSTAIGFAKEQLDCFRTCRISGGVWALAAARKPAGL